jgi:hypothetical protein
LVLGEFAAGREQVGGVLEDGEGEAPARLAEEVVGGERLVQAAE